MQPGDYDLTGLIEEYKEGDETITKFRSPDGGITTFRARDATPEEIHEIFAPSPRPSTDEELLAAYPGWGVSLEVARRYEKQLRYQESKALSVEECDRQTRLAEGERNHQRDKAVARHRRKLQKQVKTGGA